MPILIGYVNGLTTQFVLLDGVQLPRTHVKMISHGTTKKKNGDYFQTPFFLFYIIYKTKMTQQSSAMSITQLCNIEETEIKVESNEQEGNCGQITVEKLNESNYRRATTTATFYSSFTYCEFSYKSIREFKFCCGND